MKQLRLLLPVIAIMAWTNCIVACASNAKSEPDGVKEEKAICESWIHPDSVAYDKLGRRLATVLMKAQKVKVYELVPKENINSDDVEIEPHFVRGDLLETLTKEQMVVLKYSLISHGVNYHNDTTFIPLAPYCPVIEFEFTYKKEVAHVFVSMNDFEWGIRYDDKLQFKYNYGDGTFLHRFCNYFLKKRKPKTN